MAEEQSIDMDMSIKICREIDKAQTLEELEEIRIHYNGKKGVFNQMFKAIHGGSVKKDG